MSNCLVDRKLNFDCVYILDRIFTKEVKLTNRSICVTAYRLVWRGEIQLTKKCGIELLQTSFHALPFRTKAIPSIYLVGYTQHSLLLKYSNQRYQLHHHPAESQPQNEEKQGATFLQQENIRRMYGWQLLEVILLTMSKRKTSQQHMSQQHI